MISDVKEKDRGGGRRGEEEKEQERRRVSADVGEQDVYIHGV